MRACRECLSRTWLIGELAGHLDAGVADIAEVLALDDHDLLAAMAGRRRPWIERKLAKFCPDGARARVKAAGLRAVCRCDSRYPRPLHDLESAPAVLHFGGARDRLVELGAGEAVALVGARRASPYGIQVASWLGRSLAAAGVPVISGMAIGVDTAGHEGALAARGRTVAVLPGCAARAYPPSRRALHRRIAETGLVLSELPPGTAARRWMFPARNRIIAALARMTVVVEAGGQSGALLTARFARAVGRSLGAVPGRITTPHAEGCHRLLAEGARLVRGPEDVLDELFAGAPRPAAADPRPELDEDQRAVLCAIAGGDETLDSLPPGALASLAWLELAGYVRREAGGRYSMVP